MTAGGAVTGMIPRDPDHKRLGVMFLASTMIMFCIGVLYALALRLELMSAGPTSVTKTSTKSGA